MKAHYKLTIILLRKYHTRLVIFQSLNDYILNVHFKDALAYTNLSTFYILCPNKIKITSIHLNQ
jgi:hypothetical protein